MTSPKISNEMIYELLKETREDLHDFKGDMREFKNDVNRRFNQVDKQFEKIDKQFENVDAQFVVVRTDIADLNKNKIKWNAGLIGGVVAMSSIASVILIRLLHMIGIKVVALSHIIFV